MAEPGIVLLVEDDPLVLADTREMLEEAGHQVVAAATAAEARRAIGEHTIDLAVLDISLDGDTRRTPMTQRGGFRLLDAFRADAPTVPVVFVTGERSADTAMDLVARGAHHYLVKPVAQDVLLNVADLAIELGRARRQLAAFGAAQRSSVRVWYVGNTPGMKAAAGTVGLIAPTDHPVLILGETGTGKEVVAEAVHAQSTRASGPLVRVNCAAIAKDLIASMLFGHVRGAFTGAQTDHRGYFEEASGGTLFLDEVGDMPIELQPLLLRAVQSGWIRPVGAESDRRVDVRIIAATNVDLEAAIRGGRFREDLYFRLGFDPVRLPPLRERVPDIPFLAGMFLRAERAKNPRVPADFTDRAQRALMTHRWPGNTRELERVVQLGALYAQGEPAIDLAHLRFDPLGLSLASGHAPAATSRNGHGPDRGSLAPPEDLPDDGIDLPAVRDAWEERMIRQALARTHGNQTAAAAMLRMTRDMLRTRLERFEG